MILTAHPYLQPDSRSRKCWLKNIEMDKKSNNNKKEANSK